MKYSILYFKNFNKNAGTVVYFLKKTTSICVFE